MVLQGVVCIPWWRCGIVSYDVRCVIWYRAMLYCMVMYVLAWYGMVLFNILYGMVLCASPGPGGGAVWYRIVSYRMRCCSAWCRMFGHGMAWFYSTYGMARCCVHPLVEVRYGMVSYRIV